MTSIVFNLLGNPARVYNLGTVLLALAEENPVAPLGSVDGVGGTTRLNGNRAAGLPFALLTRELRNVHKVTTVHLEDGLGRADLQVDFGSGGKHMDVGKQRSVGSGVETLARGDLVGRRGVSNKSLVQLTLSKFKRAFLNSRVGSKLTSRDIGLLVVDNVLRAAKDLDVGIRSNSSGADVEEGVVGQVDAGFRDWRIFSERGLVLDLQVALEDVVLLVLGSV